MLPRDVKKSLPSPEARRFLPVLLLLFVGSGCSALIYEIVWFQLLQLVIGSSAVSLGVLLGTFMGGMCLGSLALPRFVAAWRHPLRVYALLEVGIGVFGMLILFGMPLIDHFYAAYGGQGFSGILLRGAVCAACLLPPTVLMGATLPAIARWIEATPRGASWLGFFYGGNITGAVCGCLLAGFYLLRVHDLATAVYVAAAINGCVAVLSFGLAELTVPLAPLAVSSAQAAVGRSGAWSIYLVIGLSGFCALSAEVIWTRLLSLMLGATVYTFALILAVFLVGLGLGSGVGSLLSRTNLRPRLLLGGCQLLLTAALLWTAVMLAESLPYWPIDPTLSTSPWFTFQLDLVRCLWAILPPTILWGASFPLALAALVTPGQDAGRVVGSVSAANTVGAIVGALGSSLLLIGWLGTQPSQRLLIGLSAAASLFACLPPLLTDRTGERSMSAIFRVVGLVSLVLGLGLAAWFVWRVPPVPGDLIAFGRQVPTRGGEVEILYLGEGMNASVAVARRRQGWLNFHVSGKVEASTDPDDMRLQRMLGHISALYHPNPRNVLVVGCGAGVTAGSFVTHPGLERLVLCEIEPLIPKVVADHFAVQNHNFLRDPRVEVVFDDARHYVLTAGEQFDIITSDPIHPWVKGAATLYTREYFELCKRRLKPGGLVTQWVPLYESDLATVKSELATFFEVFPNGTIWSNENEGGGYDLVLLGQADPLRLDHEDLQRRLEREDHAPAAASLAEVGFRTVLDLFATYAGRGTDLKPWLKDAEINRDSNLRLQYLAGLGLNLQVSHLIFHEMLAYCTYPEDLFIASALHKHVLQRRLAREPQLP